MASFAEAYFNWVKPNEGGYANIVGDKGGETYAGIARNYFPTWRGWAFIDEVKARVKMPIRNNTHFKELETAVVEFYQNFWDRSGIGNIANQMLANFMFDFYVNSQNTAIRLLQKAVGAKADGKLGPMTLALVNKANPAKLYNTMKEERRQLYQRLATRPQQAQFLTGWLKRLEKFPTAQVATISGVLLITAALIILLALKGK